MKPWKGIIESWELVWRGEHCVIAGVIEGEYIRTSLVEIFAPEAGYVETKNSLYGLELRRQRDKPPICEGPGESEPGEVS